MISLYIFVEQTIHFEIINGCLRRGFGRFLESFGRFNTNFSRFQT